MSDERKIIRYVFRNIDGGKEIRAHCREAAAIGLRPIKRKIAMSSILCYRFAFNDERQKGFTC